MTYKLQKLKSKLSALDEAFLVTCQYGNVETITMMIDRLVNSIGKSPQSDRENYWLSANKVNIFSEDHEQRNGFFLAALNFNTEIMRYFIEKYPELTSKTKDIHGITFSENFKEITCPNMSTPDESLSVSMIDSISQTGALKQRRIVKRLKNSIIRLNDPVLTNGSTLNATNNRQVETSRYTLVNHHNMMDVDDWYDEADEVNEKEIANKVKFDKLYKADLEMLGSGGFGEVTQGTDVKTQKKVAIKIESGKSPNPRLLYEFKIYQLFKNSNFFPKAHYHASCGDENRLVLELLGKSLESCFQDALALEQTFSSEDVLMIALQSISRLQEFHKAGFIHRDIKPDNILFGRDKDANKLFLIDFGLAKKYVKNNEHIEFQDGKSLVGTPRYCSISAGSGEEQSRKDDLESLGYVLVYFLKGKKGLPWQNLKVKKKLNFKQKYERQLRIKQNCSTEELCGGLEFSIQMKLYLDYCKKLRFKQTPDYEYLKGLFQKVMEEKKFQNDGKFSFLERILKNQHVNTANKKKKNLSVITNLTKMRIFRE